MSTRTHIEWTDRTWNPLRGCKRKSEGCRNCYAERVAWRFGAKPGTPYFGLVKMTSQGPKWTGDVRFVEKALREPLGWRTPALVFVNSMSDLFLEDVPYDFIDKVFAVMAMTPQHTYQVLTKRPERMRMYCRDLLAGGRNVMQAADDLRESSLGGIAAAAAFGWTAGRHDLQHLPRNVHLGVSIEDQRTADERIPELLLVRGASVRWISAEPLLGRIVLDPLWLRAFGHNPLKWVVVGGESGQGARPMHPDWVRSLRDQCAVARVPFLFKQWGEWLPWSQFSDAAVDDPPEKTRFQTREYFDGRWDDVGRPGYWEVMDGEVDDEHCVGRVGKKAAGRLLDGVLHDAYPEVPACRA